MTKKEFELLISEFYSRRADAITRRDNPTSDGMDGIITKNYLQGGIDAITTIIQSFEGQYKQLVEENEENENINQNKK